MNRAATGYTGGDDKPKPVQLAVIGAAHGLKGEVRVKSFTANPMAIAVYGALTAADGRRFEVTALRRQGEMLVARFAGIADRTAAEALNGVALFVDRSALPVTAEEDEFYHADLIGLAVIDLAGAKVGTVTAIHDFGAGDVLEVRRDDARTILIPFTKAAVPTVDFVGGRVVVDPAAAGLLPDPDDDAEPPE